MAQSIRLRQLHLVSVCLWSVNVVLWEGLMRTPIIRCPLEFSGSFKIFFDNYVEPNLPSVERVRLFDAIMSGYMASENPAHIVRSVKGIVRGVPNISAFNDRIIGSDNSPGWWIHAVLYGLEPLSGSPDAFFERIPTHMFRIPKVDTLNRAGYHLAHIIPAKNLDTNWQSWSKSELERRFLLNVHPCNWFPIAKTDWRTNGGRADIIDWVKSAYRERYGDLYVSFAERTGTKWTERLEVVSAPTFSFSASKRETKMKANERVSVNSGTKTHRKSTSVKLLEKNRPFVEKKSLGHDIKLSIRTVGMRFLIPHDTLWYWVELETNVPNTKSWIDNGYYSWPKPSADMLKFLSDFEVKD